MCYIPKESKPHRGQSRAGPRTSGLDGRVTRGWESVTISSESIFVLQADVKNWQQFRENESLLESRFLKLTPVYRLSAHMNLNIFLALVKATAEALFSGHMSSLDDIV